MTNLNEWLKRIDDPEVKLSKADKAAAKKGLRREFKGTRATWNLDNQYFSELFNWGATKEGSDFWYEVNRSLVSAHLDYTLVSLSPTAIDPVRDLIAAAKKYKRLQALAEAAEREI